MVLNAENTEFISVFTSDLAHSKVTSIYKKTKKFTFPGFPLFLIH